jgi:hypothetical protein
MSGGIVQLVATGAQDAWLTGKPEVSFFRSNYRRYTHYANTVERQVIQGAPIAGGISTVRFEKKGDLINYVYLAARDGNGSMCTIVDWSKVIDKIEFMIGGQVIDTQDVVYSTQIEPVTGAQNYSQRLLIGNTGDNEDPTNSVTGFYPLKFFFNKDWSVSLPLVALQFHDVELRITWSSSLADSTAGFFTAPGANNGPQIANYNNLQYICWTNFTYLDQAERDFFANTPQDMLITQVQRTIVMGSETMQELALAQPVKFIAFTSNNYSQAYGALGVNSALVKDHMLKTQVNGTDVGEFRHLPAFVELPQYYNTPFGYLPNGVNAGTANVGMISYCLDTSKLQPTGTLNFSRLDTYRLVVPPTITIGALIKSTYLYAISYNVLRIQNGLGSVLYSS